MTQIFTAGIYINIHQLPKNRHIVQFPTSCKLQPTFNIALENAQSLLIISLREIENG